MNEVVIAQLEHGGGVISHIAWEDTHGAFFFVFVTPMFLQPADRSSLGHF